MALRFRKTLRLAPGLRVNLAKRGASLSVGRRGMSYNVNRDGGRATVGAPGTGLSYSTRRSRRNRGGSVLGGLILLGVAILLLHLLR